MENSLRVALPRTSAVSASAFDRAVAAVDASHYLLTPRAVVTPESIDEMAALFAWATSRRETITFRSGGTSLSGQASTGAILADTRRHFRAISIEQDGLIARVGPGATVRQVNARLLRHNRKLGPDPASEIACTIGGVVANNSSGMACGIEQNAYNTLRSAIVVLPSGTVVDTSQEDSVLKESEPEIWQALTNLRAEVTSDSVLSDEIRRQYRIKNTMGYGLNSLLDHETPTQILAHLIVGSEGTLGFVAEATFNTVPLLKQAATVLLVFDSLQDATDSLIDVVRSTPATVELMDAASLRAARTDPRASESLPDVEVTDHCALLVEYQAADANELLELCAGAERLFPKLKLSAPPTLTRDPTMRASLWRIRKGLYATIVDARPSGTTALLEDIAVPVDRLADTSRNLAKLLAEYGYDNAVIFGHAKDGNLHFLITEDFDDESNLARYRAFTEGLVELVLNAGGTLKAEHGTGRIMAPFVSRQYGPTLYRVMQDIKRAIDPAGILNPTAVLSDDAELHLRNLKSTPTVQAEVDRCVECGYCEPACPSKDLTTTPRQRIVVQRAIAAAELSGNDALARELRVAQRYDVVDTCAVDGMCEVACPVLINTGDLVRRLRSESVGHVDSMVWNTAGKAWGTTTKVASMVLSVAARIPEPVVAGPNKLIRTIVGSDRLPLWSKDLPRGGEARRAGVTKAAEAVYFQSCVGAMFGQPEGGAGVANAFQSLAVKAGIGLLRPESIGDLCCGTPWKSKGIVDGYRDMVDRTGKVLWEASDFGRLPIVCDNSSCSEGLAIAVQKSYPGLTVVDAVDFAAQRILPRLRIESRLESVAVHPTCSSTRAGSNHSLEQLARAVAQQVTVPDNWGCCAFAGDRGMLHPELTASATSMEAAEMSSSQFDAYVSCNRTCEIGMSRATGKPYEHILEVVDRASTNPN